MTLPLVALTSYYNPFRGERRRRNFHLFRRHLGIPLVAVEWSRDGQFDLAPGDADVLLRVEGGDLMWQKERLLNRGLARIRADAIARDVLLIDADAVFAEAGWAERVSAQLEASPLVQAYARVDYLPPLPPEEDAIEQLAAATPESALPSLASALSRGRRFFDATRSWCARWRSRPCRSRGTPACRWRCGSRTCPASNCTKAISWAAATWC